MRRPPRKRDEEQELTPAEQHAAERRAAADKASDETNAARLKISVAEAKRRREARIYVPLPPARPSS